jgi:two-component system phosphate regulon response regulator PhoB
VGKTILIVVRDRDTRECLAQGFGDRGFQAITATDGIGGLFQFGLSQPDLIVLDLTCWETLRRLRALSTVPIIVLIDDEPGMRVESLNEGADYFVVKPPSLPELEAKARALFRRDASALTPALPLE